MSYFTRIREASCLSTSPGNFLHHIHQKYYGTLVQVVWQFKQFKAFDVAGDLRLSIAWRNIIWQAGLQ